MMYAARGRQFLRWAVQLTRRGRELPAELRFRAEARRQLDNWRQQAASGLPLVDIFGEVDDVLWLWLNTAGRRFDSRLAEVLPGVPSQHLQEQYTGSAGDVTLREGWNAFRLFRDLYTRHAEPLTPQTRVVDFGCGWGRVIRFFLKDVAPDHLLGLDINATVLEEARRAMPRVRLQQVGVMPPMACEDGSQDLIYAYSVFSHLSRDAHDRWLQEFRRVLAPGGIVIATTWPRSFIEHCHRLRTDPSLRALPDSHLVSARAFPDKEAAIRQYDEGGFCFSHRGGDDPPHFGEACLSQVFVESEWSKLFSVREYISDRKLCPQNVIVAKRTE